MMIATIEAILAYALIGAHSLSIRTMSELFGVRIASSGMVISTGATGSVYECKRKISVPTEKGDKTMWYLERFIIAQEKFYEAALDEIVEGEKKSCWMWFVFPQITGLGYSKISKYFSIKSRGEAEAYLAHPVLGERLEEISEALLELETNDPVEVFGEIDAAKLQASMTLFWIISGKDVFADVLVKYFGGYLCFKTVQILRTMEV